VRVVLSRKGLDAAWGGCPSPILPDGRLVPLPIPEPAGPSGPSGIRYADIAVPGPHRSASALLRALGREDVVHPAAGYRGERGRVVRVPLRRARAHLDPDLVAGAVPRELGWRPAFGQAGGAQSHLAAQGVGAGDLFLYFGWFRGTRSAGGRRLRWDGPDLHVLWGWLEVAEVLHLDDPATAVPPWPHPHVDGRDLPRYAAGNALYLAAERLSLDPRLPGAGVLPALQPVLRLTAEGATRSVWDLPAALHPDATPRPLSWHSSARWSRGPEPGRARLRSVRGQEFVVDATDGVLAWVRDVLAAATPPAERQASGSVARAGSCPCSARS
jgi:hypothetical protein